VAVLAVHAALFELLTFICVESYTGEYYEDLRAGALSSARVVAPLVYGLVQPKSVVDLGCGTGEWLSVFAELGAEEILGVEHPGFERSLLSVPSAAVVEHDLREPFRADRRFDLAVSLEVAEHLPPERAETFVEDLTLLAPVVLFSAAPPGLDNPKITGHVNERWQSFWAKLFAQRRYEVVDCVRPGIWEDKRVDHWYAQDTILYVASERLISDEALKQAKEENKAFPLSVIYPTIDPRSEAVALRKRLTRQKQRITKLENQLEAARRRNARLEQKVKKLERRGGEYSPNATGGYTKR
jgi:SAM-dependent methyltransferase